MCVLPHSSYPETCTLGVLTLHRCRSGLSLCGVCCVCSAVILCGTGIMLDGRQSQFSPHKSQCGLQALQETFLIFRLAVLLYSYLGLGTRWTGKLTRLIVYSMLLLPGFIQVRCATVVMCIKLTLCCIDRSPP